MVKNLCLPQIKPICDSYNATHIKQVNNFYCNYVLYEKKVPFDKIEKLYIRKRGPRLKQVEMFRYQSAEIYEEPQRTHVV